MTCDSQSIREAIARGDYGGAKLLWEDYTGALRDELSAGSVKAERWAECQELFAWSRNVLMCARAHNLDQLNAFHVAGVYERIRTL